MLWASDGLRLSVIRNEKEEPRLKILVFKITLEKMHNNMFTLVGSYVSSIATLDYVKNLKKPPERGEQSGI